MEKQKTFEGKLMYDFELMKSSAFSGNLNECVLSAFSENDDVNVILKDPTHQASLIKRCKVMMASSYLKGLDKTWKESLDALIIPAEDGDSRLKSMLKSYLKEFMVIKRSFYMIDVTEVTDKDPDEFNYTMFGMHINDPFLKTSKKLVDKIPLEKTDSFEELTDLIYSVIEKECIDYMNPYIKEENIKRINDMNLLKILLAKYPDFEKELEEEALKELKLNELIKTK